jgi:hypothetical protein
MSLSRAQKEMPHFLGAAKLLILLAIPNRGQSRFSQKGFEDTHCANSPVLTLILRQSAL